jgi:hypothetical protein
MNYTTSYEQHIVDIGNLWPMLRSASARNDWTLIEVHAQRIADAASRLAAIAKSQGYAEELIRRAEVERQARQAQLQALAETELDE